MSTEGKNPWAKIIGPCYRTASIARSLGWAEAEVLDAAVELEVLDARHSRGESALPGIPGVEGQGGAWTRPRPSRAEQGDNIEVDLGAIAECTVRR